MTAPRALARAAARTAGAVVIAAPLVRALSPAGTGAARLSGAEFLALEAGIALFAVFAGAAASARGRRAAAGFAALAAAAAGAGAWTARFLGTDRAVFLPHDPDVVAVAGFTVVAVLLAAWRTGGRPVAGLAALAVAAALAAPLLGGAASPARTVTYLVYGTDGLLGRALDIMVDPVLAFVLFGAVFDASGGGRAIEALALAIARRSRAGAIRACVLASGLFGTISGTAISNVMTTGAFSIPSMRRIGVRRETAAGIEAAASTAGQVMPPVMGAAAFLLADFTATSYADVAAAALLPALGVYFAMFRQASLVALGPAPGPVPVSVSGPASGARAAPGLTRAMAVHVLPPAVLVGVLVASELQPTRAAVAGTLCSLAVGFALQGPRATLAGLWRGGARLVQAGLQLVVIAAAMGLVLGVLNLTGIAVAATVWLGALGDESLALAVVVTAGAAFVLGIGMATVGVYILAAAMLAPGLVVAGVPPLAAHLFVLYCGLLSMLTPPVALAALAASALTGAGFTATAWAALRFGWILFAMPFAIVLHPGLVLADGPGGIATAALLTAGFIWTATAPGLTLGMRATTVALAAAALLWRGPGWVALGLMLAVVGALWLHARRRG